MSNMLKFIKERGAEYVKGNEITSKYELPEENSASAGHDLLWKVYPAISKKTKEHVSIWIFDKGELSKVPKDQRDKVLDIMHAEINTLKVLRHPFVVKIVEVFEDNRKFLAFASERVTYSLANVNKNFFNIANPSQELRNTNLSEFEVTSGLMNVAEGLAFLHKDARRVHSGLSPNAIVLTPKGAWKVAGLGFSAQVEVGKTLHCGYFHEKHSQSIQKSLYTTEPNICYAAPEMVQQPREYGPSADIFALGLLTFEFLKGPGTDGSTEPLLDVRDGNPLTYSYKLSNLHPLRFPPTIPPLIQQTLAACLQLSRTGRCDARGFLQSPFFDSGPIQTLRQLQSLFELDTGRQAEYLSALPPLLEPFPPRILRDMVLPCLTTLTMNRALTPFLLPPLFVVVQKVSKEEFEAQVAPYLAPLIAVKDPPQVTLIVAQNLKQLLAKASKPFVRDHVLPMLVRALDSNVEDAQDLVLKQLADVSDLFDYHLLKGSVLPRVVNVLLRTSTLSVRVNALMYLAKTQHLFDKTVLAETFLPTLQRIFETVKTPAVCMCIVGCYDEMGKTLGPEYMAKNMVPLLAQMLWEKGLNSQQFDLVCTRMQAMIAEIIKERERQLQDETSASGHTAKLEMATGLSLSKAAVDMVTDMNGNRGSHNVFEARGVSADAPSGSASRPKPYYEEGGEEEPMSAWQREHRYKADKDRHKGDRDRKGRRASGERSRASDSPPSYDRPDDDDPFYLKKDPSSYNKPRDREQPEKARRSSKTKKREGKPKRSSKGGGETSSDLLDVPGGGSSAAAGALVDDSGLFNNLSLTSSTGALVPSTMGLDNMGGMGQGGGSGQMFSGMNMGGTAGMSGAMVPHAFVNGPGGMSGSPPAMSAGPVGFPVNPSMGMGNHVGGGMGMGMSGGMPGSGLGMPQQQGQQQMGGMGISGMPQQGGNPYQFRDNRVEQGNFNAFEGL